MLARRTSLKRGKRLRARRPTPRRVSPDRVRSDEHRARVRGMRICVSKGLPGAVCGGAIECSHRDEGKGMGLKASDLASVPQCHSCHRDWTDHQGPFAGWSLQRRREWFAGKVRLTLFILGFSLEDVNRVQPEIPASEPK